MFVLDPTNLIPVSGLFKYVVDASELGLPPGKFPTTMETSLGNKQPLVFDSMDEEGGVRYIQSAGILEVFVFND